MLHGIYRPCVRGLKRAPLSRAAGVSRSPPAWRVRTIRVHSIPFPEPGWWPTLEVMIGVLGMSPG
jgi:hypothetical protein